MNNKTPKNLIAVGILAIMLLGARSAFAYVPGVWDPQPRVQTNETAFTEVPNPSTYFTPEVTPEQTIVTSNTTTTKPSSTTKTITRNTTTTNQTVSNSNLPPVESDQSASGFSSDTSNNGLSALSLQGNGGFMPSSIWQWILVVFAILAIIIIARLFKKPEEHHVAVH